MLVLRELKAPCPSELARMTFANYRPLLQRLGKDPGLSSFAAIKNRQPVGLLLGNFADQTGELLSVYIAPTARGKGIAGKLLRQFEQQAVARGCSKLKSAFSTAMPGYNAIKRVFEKSSWGKPEMNTKLVHFSREKLGKELTDNPRFAKYREPNLSGGFQLVKWHELSPKQLEAVAAKHNQPDGWQDRDTPFREPEKQEKLNSFAILKNDQVVGWFITHRINPDTIRYNQVYNDPVTKGKRGIIIQTAIHAFWRHYEAGPENGCFIIYQWNTPLLKIFDKLMYQLVDSFTESYDIKKNIAEPTQ